jgi:hypothetical protein
MKIVKELADTNIVSFDSNWNLDVTFDGKNVQLNMNISAKRDENIVYVNTNNIFDLQKLSSEITDFSIFMFGSYDILDSNTFTKTETKSKIINVTKITNPSKLNSDDLQKIYGITPYALLLIPFANSTPNDMILVACAPKNTDCKINFKGFNKELPATDSSRSLIPQWMAYMPTLSSQNNINLSVANTTPFVVQLTDTQGNNINNSNVTIYLQTTGGVLDNKRITTDKKGQAIGHITALTNDPFTIDLGFKYVEGLSKIQVN